MGTYCTTTALDTIMVGVTFDAATNSLAGLCITQAETEIRKHLSRRYAMGTGTAFALTTTAATPPMVTTICEWYSSGLLYTYQSRGGKESLTRGKELRKMATDNLESIADYEQELNDTSGANIIDKPKTSFRVLSNTTNFTETFLEDDPLNWVVDRDKLSDISDSRD